jgi:2'-5' RNA ligase
MQKRTARLFFAIWPNAAARDQLDQVSRRLHQACGGRQTRAATIHQTLVFLGEVELERVDTLLALAAGIRIPAFELRLTRFNWWRRKRLAWAAPEETPPALAELVAELERRLKEADFRFDERPYSPHVTLVRKAECDLAGFSAQPIGWRVEEFVLVRSTVDENGSNYEFIGRWPLLR